MKKPKEIRAHHWGAAGTATQEPDLTPGNYYVSIKDGQKFGLLAGPFKTHAEAIAMVGQASAMAKEVDPWAAFASFGTVKMADSYMKPGVLNDKLGLKI